MTLMPNYAAPRVTFVRGEGSHLWDTDGREYLDFLCGIAVTSLGHAHPAVADAVCSASRTLLHVSNLFGTEPQREVAATLDRLLGGGGKVFFANSGAEANECAIKLARRSGGPARRGIVSALGSFHGRTLGALAATGQPAKHEPFTPLPGGFRHVEYGDLDALAAAVDGSVAAVLLESVQGESGVVTPAAGYLAGARRICDDAGALLVLDEVQTGLGRTGRWWGFEHEGIRPDVVTSAKALGNGVPIGACWARAEVADAFRPGDHGSTFGGQPLAASAARAVLAVMEAEDVPARAAAMGARLHRAAEAVAGVTGVRGVGLLLAAELAVPSADAAAACLEHGLVVNNVTPTALRLAPSLLITPDEVDEGVSRLAAALRALA